MPEGNFPHPVAISAFTPEMVCIGENNLFPLASGGLSHSLQLIRRDPICRTVKGVIASTVPLSILRDVAVVAADCFLMKLIMWYPLEEFSGFIGYLVETLSRSLTVSITFLI